MFISDDFGMFINTSLSWDVKNVMDEKPIENVCLLLLSHYHPHEPYEST